MTDALIRGDATQATPVRRVSAHVTFSADAAPARAGRATTPRALAGAFLRATARSAPLAQARRAGPVPCALQKISTEQLTSNCREIVLRQHEMQTHELEA